MFIKNNCTKQSITLLREYMGDVCEEQLKYVDCFFSKNIAIIMPIAGACGMSSIPRHKHPSYTFLISFTNTSIFKVDAERIKASPNKIYFLNSSVPHDEYCECNIPRYLGIFIRKNYFLDHSDNYFKNNYQYPQYGIYDLSDNLVQILMRFIDECKKDNAESRIMQEAISIEIVHHLLRVIHNNDNNSCIQSKRMEIYRTIDYMRLNLSEKLSLSVLAAYTSMSVSHFSRVFKNEMGISAMEYLINLRL